MKIALLRKEIWFPPPDVATPEGIVAAGGDFSPDRLLLAYRSGIFPWPMQGVPLLWFSPDPRYVLQPRAAHLGRSLRKKMRKNPFDVRADTAFGDVIRACGTTPRPGQDGTWVTPALVKGYETLHAMGIAHSIESWQDGKLVGGLYGVSLGGFFFGESMFAHVEDASKVAFATLLANLALWDFDLVDCQVHTPHLERFGAEHWPRELFLAHLQHSLTTQATKRGPWVFDLSSSEAEDLLKET